MVAPVLLTSTIIRYLLVGIGAAHHCVQFPRAGVMKPSGKLWQDMSDQCVYDDHFCGTAAGI